jgi:hypothetical protein
MKQVFPMIPAGAESPLTLIAVGALLLGLLALFGYIFYSSRNVTYEVSAEGLRIRGGLYGRLVPAAALRAAEARELNMAEEGDRALSWRTNGFGLPGYAAGWFKLKNGEKALAFITDRRSAVYVPTTEGYAIVLSVADREGFLRSLRALPGGR